MDYRPKVIVALRDRVESATIAAWLDAKGFDPVESFGERAALDRMTSEASDLVVTDADFKLQDGLRKAERARNTRIPAAIRACFVRVRPPEGLTLDRTVGRALFDVVEDVRSAVRAPAVDHIVITGAFVASAAAYSPVWRLRKRRTLVLGLPVLTTLSAEELRAVVAHELAHFSSAHDRFGAWVYRTRGGWLALRAALDARLATPVYVYWLLRWYVPRLDGASAEVSRRHEFAADAVAATVTGSRAVADALIAFEAGARYADDTFWPAIGSSHEIADEPPRPYTQMLTWNARIASAEALDAVWYVPGHGFVDDAATLKADLPAFRRAIEQVIAESARLYNARIPCPAPTPAARAPVTGAPTFAILSRK